jgi:glycerophosphoryl diester phosphodiesterase
VSQHSTWQPQAKSCIVLGHRGARNGAPENTLRAFELARVQGASGSELDVQTSLDGHLHVVHDLDLKRVTSGRDPRTVRSLTRAELDQVSLAEGDPIPHLEDVLSWAERHDQLLNVELKSANSRADTVAEATAALLNDNRWAETHVCVSSFHPRLLKRLHQRAPKIRTAFIVGSQHAAWCTPEWLESLGVNAVHPQFQLLLNAPHLIEQLNGFQVNTWTVNDPAQARTLRALGVFALISDDPGRLIAGLGW